MLMTWIEIEAHSINNNTITVEKKRNNLVLEIWLVVIGDNIVTNDIVLCHNSISDSILL